MAGTKGLALYDVANPESPTFLCVFDPGAFCYGGCTSILPLCKGIQLFAGGDGVVAIDMTDPKAPVNFGVRNSGVISSCGGCAMVKNEKAVFVAGGKGLGIFDLDENNSGLGKRRSIVNTGCLSHENAIDLLLEDKILYVAGGNGLAIFDVDKLLVQVEEGNADNDSEEQVPITTRPATQDARSFLS